MGTDEFWRLADRHLIRYGAAFDPRIIERAAGCLRLRQRRARRSSTSPRGR